jgi:hypothetical protein
MLAHEEVIRRQYADLTALFKSHFPNIAPPEPRWWSIWLQKYPARDISEAITELSKHSLKARFTTDSTGRAISAILRQKSVARVIVGEVTP